MDINEKEYLFALYKRTTQEVDKAYRNYEACANLTTGKDVLEFYNHRYIEANARLNMLVEIISYYGFYEEFLVRCRGYQFNIHKEGKQKDSIT